MSFSIVYKKIFELRLIHPFFLEDGSYFNDADPTHLTDVNYDIFNHISIQPILSCKQLLDGQRMRFRETPFGFMVFVEAKKDADGDYKPTIPLSNETTFRFGIKIKNSYFDNISNTRLRPNIKGIFHFDNFRDKVNSQSMSLSRSPVTDFDRHYEMGEIVNDGSSIKIAKEAMWKNGANWLAFDNANFKYFDYVTYNDRLLIPSVFNYQFSTNNKGVIQPTFSLHDAVGEVSRLEITSNTIVHKKQLDYSKRPSGWYQLKVNAAATSTTPEYKEEKNLFINDELYNPFLWGVIEINNNSDNTDFKLLNSNGKLVFDSQTPKELTPPVFEIRPLNRATYWKYFFNEGDIPNPNLQDTSELKLEQISPPTFYESKAPLFLSRFSKPLQILNQSVQIPIPYQFNLKPLGSKIFSEIYLPKIKQP